MVGRLRWAVKSSSWIPTKQEWVDGLSVLQPEEVDRVGKFVFQKDAKFALVGRLLIWAGLSEHMGGISIGHLRQGFKLGRSSRGKPELLDATGSESRALHFNISHQGDYVVLATEKGNQVGVDVMQLSEPRNSNLQEFFRLMRRQFTEKEWLQIAPHQPILPEQQLHNFYRFWCLKESFIKAEGSGLSYGLQNLEFVCGGECDHSSRNCYCLGSQLFIRHQRATNWQFQEYMLDSEHCVAVAVGRDSEQTLHHDNSDCVTVPEFSIVTVPWLLKSLQVPHSANLKYEMDWKLFQQKNIQC